jgi:hypothetical protein
MPADDPQSPPPNPSRPLAGTRPFPHGGSFANDLAMPAVMDTVEYRHPGSSRELSTRGGVAAPSQPGSNPAREAGADGPTAELRLVVQRLTEVNEKVEHLTRAIQSRDVIGQAKGILMERYRITSEQAFELLVATSSASNSKLAAVAAHLTATGALEQPPHSGP